MKDNLEDIIKPLKNYLSDLDSKVESISKFITNEKSKLSKEELSIVNGYQKEIMNSALDGDNERVEILMQKMNEKLRNANTSN